MEYGHSFSYRILSCLHVNSSQNLTFLNNLNGRIRELKHTGAFLRRRRQAEACFSNSVLTKLFFFFVFDKSKNKKAAALPFVLATPLDSEKGMDILKNDSFLRFETVNTF